MLQVVFEFILNSIRDLANFFIVTIIDPFLNLVMSFIPNWSSYSATIINFLNDYFFKGISFALQVFYNITGFPPALFAAIIGYVGLVFSFVISSFAIKAFINAISFIRFQRSSIKVVNGFSKGG